MGGAETDRRLVVAAHADADHGQAVRARRAWPAARCAAPRPRLRAGSPSARRSRGPARRGRVPRNSSSSAGHHARFLRLLAGVDLDEQPGAAPLARHLLARVSRASLGRSSVWITSNSATASAALLDCRPPIRCSSTPGQRSRAARPAPLGLLHVVLAEHALARRQRRLDPGFRLRLADRDQGDGGRRPPPRPCAAAIRARTVGEAGGDVDLLTRLRHGVLAPLKSAASPGELG